MRQAGIQFETTKNHIHKQITLKIGPGRTRTHHIACSAVGPAQCPTRKRFIQEVATLSVGYIVTSIRSLRHRIIKPCKSGLVVVFFDVKKNFECRSATTSTSKYPSWSQKSVIGGKTIIWKNENFKKIFRVTLMSWKFFFTWDFMWSLPGFNGYRWNQLRLPIHATMRTTLGAEIGVWMATLNIRLRWQFLTVRTSIPIGKLLNRAIII